MVANNEGLSLIGNFDREKVIADCKRYRHENVIPFVEEAHIHCPTPKVLLEELALMPGTIDFLLLDSPNAPELLREFLDIKGLSPVYIRFHWLWGGHLASLKEAKERALESLVQELASRG